MTRLEHHRAFALRIAKRDDPRVLQWLGATVTVFVLLNHLLPPPSHSWVWMGGVAIGLTMLAAGRALASPRVPEQTVPWAFSAAIAVFNVWSVVIHVDLPAPSDLAYTLIATTAFGPLVLAWAPFACTVAVSMLALAWGLAATNEPYRADWLLGFAAACAVSAILLRIRLRLMDELADAEAAVAELSRQDQLTGLLNRRGIEEQLPGLLADARRRGEYVHLFFIDIRGLKAANDGNGHAFGDAILRDVAAALRVAVRERDVVGRWGGDEFVVIGIGQSAPAEALEQHLHDRIVEQGRADRSRWSGRVSVGLASCPAAECSFEQLLGLADTHMYERRRQLD